MRRALAEQDGERKKFQAIFVKFGRKTNYRGHSEETVLLKNIIDVENKKIVADHLWFTYTKNFQQVPMTDGSHIEFEARIKKYNKGYINRRYKIDNRTTDYKLSHPTKICLKEG
jgi:phosphoribulokinase